MKQEISTPEQYIEQLPDERKVVFNRLRAVVLENLPSGFSEVISYGMISYVVPYSIYPQGYHANPQEPVPFISIASQKNHIALYHMGLGLFPEVLEWFVSEYPNYAKGKLDMGKSCIRFRKPEALPYDLIAKLCQKITLEDYLEQYVLRVTQRN